MPHDRDHIIALKEEQTGKPNFSMSSKLERKCWDKKLGCIAFVLFDEPCHISVEFVNHILMLNVVEVV